MRLLFAALALMLAVPATAQPEEVRIASEPGVVIAGTLQMPEERAGPASAVLFLAGAGPWPRGGFRRIEERLAAAGIATLSFDKRGIGRSTGNFDEAADLIERDAAAALAWLRTRPDIDQDRVAIVGHSQGGVAGPAIAARDGRIAALAILAAPVGSRRTMFIDELRGHLTRGGRSPDRIERIADAVRAWLDGRANGAAPDRVASSRAAAVAAFAADDLAPEEAEAMVAALDPPVIVSMYLTGPAEALAAINAPVLALFAANDEIVTEGSIDAARTALRDKPDATVTVLPGLSHALQRPPVGDAPADYPAPEVVELVAGWLTPRLTGPRD